MNAEMIAKALNGRRAAGSGYLCHCPVASHGRRRGDRNPSLLVRDGDFRLIVVHCFSGCKTTDIFDEFRRRKLIPDLATSSESRKHNGTDPGGSTPRIAAIYDYTDEGGKLLFQVLRHQPKAFKQRRPDGRGGWIWDLKQTRRVLYRLPELIEAASAEQCIFVVEGEKDSDSLRKLNIPATTCPGGANKWLPEYSDCLRGCHVVLIPDNDDTGRAHMDKVAASLRGMADSIRILRLPGLPSAGDVSDWLADGGSAEALWQIVDATAQWAPSEVDRPKESSGLVTVCAALIVPERISWLWRGRLARGKHTCLAGEPGTGKSQLGIHIVAAVTTGGEWPCGEGRAPVGNAIILSAEDGAADTIIPRLMAAGADRGRVHIVSAVRNPDGSRRTLNLQSDLDLLERKIAEIGNVVLVVVDPVSSYLGKTDSHKNSEVRGVLEPLSEMAEHTRTAILSVTHFSKAGANNTTKALHRFIGSIAFTGAPRAAFAVIEDAEHDGRRLFLHAKNNLAPAPQGLAFRLEQCLVGDGIVASRILWNGEPVPITANEALAAEAAGTETRTAKAEATDFLQSVLAGQPVAAADVNRMAREHGLTTKAIRSAREALGVKIERDGFGPGSKSLWSLPEGL